jgi:hypothetical protein
VIAFRHPRRMDRLWNYQFVDVLKSRRGIGCLFAWP